MFTRLRHFPSSVRRSDGLAGASSQLPALFTQRAEPIELLDEDRMRPVYLLLEHGAGQLSSLCLQGLFVGIELRLGATQDPIFSRSGIYVICSSHVFDR